MLVRTLSIETLEISKIAMQYYDYHQKKQRNINIKALKCRSLQCTREFCMIKKRSRVLLDCWKCNSSLVVIHSSDFLAFSLHHNTKVLNAST